MTAVCILPVNVSDGNLFLRHRWREHFTHPNSAQQNNTQAQALWGREREDVAFQGEAWDPESS